MAEQYTFTNDRGYFGIGILAPKFESNMGVLWRAAVNFQADYLFSIGARYHRNNRTDTVKSYKHTPFFEYDDFSEYISPKNSELVCVEIGPEARNLLDFRHPERASYLLGAEDSGLPSEVLDVGDHIVQIPSKFCMNVSMAGVTIMWDRILKGYLDRNN
jgi:tRNA(Leu) C34 or U34 (ribose-2'-O)-methylase TrmL